MRLAADVRTLFDRLTPVAAGAVGGLFFSWIAGLRVLMPTEFNWVMQGDWRIHFLGWHFFRREPWLLPPGRIDGYLHAPDGSAIGFTDSIPLAALALKPLSALLPDTFQYLGLWLLACFILQGVFGALLAGLWTSRRSLQLLGVSLFVLTPSLLARVGHPALCAHWLILWGLWLYLRGARGTTQSPRQQGAVGLLSGLVHPYLAVMVLLILGALVVKDVSHAFGVDRRRTRVRALGSFACAASLVLVGWWASGLFTVAGVENLASEGLGRYSMNVLSPITPRSWSTLVPEWTTAPADDHNESFQYLGLGALVLIGAAGLVAVRRVRTLPWPHLWPLLTVVAVGVVYAMSPRGLDLDRLALFRASSRFFWPAAYLILASSIAVAVTRLQPRVSFVVLFACGVLQLVDLREAHLERHAHYRSASFHAHQLPLTSPVWHTALPYYRHMVLYPPQQCGDSAAPSEWLAYLAGRHVVTINAGAVARFDADKSAAYCHALDATLANGEVRDDTLYVVERSRVAGLLARATAPIVCGEVDRLPICITARSFERWRRHAALGSI